MNVDMEMGQTRAWAWTQAATQKLTLTLKWTRKFSDVRYHKNRSLIQYQNSALFSLILEIPTTSSIRNCSSRIL
jgi:hypothetical protein